MAECQKARDAGSELHCGVWLDFVWEVSKVDAVGVLDLVEGE